jgi:hypothetical protein
VRKKVKNTMTEHHDTDKPETPNGVASKLFIYTLLGAIAWAAAVILYVEVFAS